MRRAMETITGKCSGMESAATLIRKAKGGDERALEALYFLYKNRVYGWCRRLTSDTRDSEDLSQEVFIRMSRKLQDFRHEAAFSTWLYRITLNSALMHRRKRSIYTELIRPETLDLRAQQRHWVAYQYGCNSLLGLALKRAIAQLPAGSRNVLILHDIHGMTHREIGKHLGIAAVTSKTQLHYAHRKLRSFLNPTSVVKIHVQSVVSRALTT